MEAKDLQRIRDIISQDPNKHSGLANKMAKLITDREKCYRRFEAAKHLLGEAHPITQIFHRRWHVLHGTGLIEEAPAAPVEEIKEVREAASSHERIFFGTERETVGIKNPSDAPLRKGKVKGVLEIWKSWSMEIIHVFRKGEVPRAAIGSIANFNDENNEFLFGGTMLDWTPSENLAAAIQKYGDTKQVRSYIE